jgi:hypothetical protein
LVCKDMAAYNQLTKVRAKGGQNGAVFHLEALHRRTAR